MTELMPHEAFERCTNPACQELKAGGYCAINLKLDGKMKPIIEVGPEECPRTNAPKKQ